MLLQSGALDVFSDQVGIDGDRRRRAAPADVITWDRGSTTLPTAQTPAVLVADIASGLPAAIDAASPEQLEHLV